ncbi:hypothetical protein [Enterobacter huaxiensis]|uniref:hypothetical protein n=1 Tax=Enterobacter huaxiensis TaxID=2494702 RepID=UPI000E7401A9|nr:hypothetical protein [Enterobacter huaxiensis]UNC49866.1 hypothetical protein D5067_0009900 [Enterobacter huaxiensis]
MNLKSKLWYFWGGMDILAILFYCVNAGLQNRIPFISDIMAFSGLANTVSGGGYSGLVMVFFIFDLLLLLSLFASAWFFFKRKAFAIKFALVQEVFRLISFRCSVSIFPVALSLFGISNVWLNLGLFVLSEGLKVYSLLFLMREKESVR